MSRVMYWFMVLGGVLFMAYGLVTSDFGRSAFGGVCLLFADRIDDRNKR